MSATLQSRPSLYSTAVGKKYVMAISGMVLMALRARAHGRQPEALLRGRVAGRVQPLAARGRRAGAAARVAAVGRADRAARRAVRAPVGGVHADDDQPPRAAERVPLQARLRGRGLRQPHDALDRDHRRCCSSSSTCSTSRGGRRTRTSSAATRTTTSSRPSSGSRSRSSTSFANLALGVHLYHGAWSLFQSMGWVRPWRRQFAIVFAAVIVARQRLLPARRRVRSGQLSA